MKAINRDVGGLPGFVCGFGLRVRSRARESRKNGIAPLANSAKDGAPG